MASTKLSRLVADLDELDTMDTAEICKRAFALLDFETQSSVMDELQDLHDESELIDEEEEGDED